MSMRYPAIPLIAIDPYFSVWSNDNLADKVPYHWTEFPNSMLGTVTVDGEEYRFLGKGTQKVLEQTSVTVDAFSSTYVFCGADIELTARFTSPTLVTDLYYVSRPVSYLCLSYKSLSGKTHKVSASITLSEEFVLNKAGEGRALARAENIDGVSAVSMAKADQKVLWRSGDNLRIDWGRLYLAVRGNAECQPCVFDDLYAIRATADLCDNALFLFAYDDIKSIEYNHEQLSAYWKKDGKTIESAIAEAASEYEELLEKCNDFSKQLAVTATNSANVEYAELLTLAYRQIMAAHKLVVDKNGNNFYISKECSSNGCAATVDVTYPSSPMYLLYNTELLKGMLRPVFEFAASDDWKWDFAPHDVGQYPLLNGQVYGEGELKNQMPIEESGNIMILVAAICKKENNYDFARENLSALKNFSKYLEKYGADPENQLCTDDFAGHLAHNVNLAIKAVMGLAGYSDILSNSGEETEANRIMSVAANYAAQIKANAKNTNALGTRLAFDKDGTFSLKYNAVWDKLWGTNLFGEDFFAEEMRRYKSEALPFGVPLDSREKYTKSDWEMWVACLGTREDFCFFSNALHKAYSTMEKRVPMCDWYRTDSSQMVGFKHRTVQGGLLMKLLFD